MLEPHEGQPAQLPQQWGASGGAIDGVEMLDVEIFERFDIVDFVDIVELFDIVVIIEITEASRLRNATCVPSSS